MEYGSENGGTGTRPLSQSLNERTHAYQRLLADPDPESAHALERAYALERTLELVCTLPYLEHIPRLQRAITRALELARALAGAVPVR